MLDIFLKLGVIEILFTAQSVCSSWRDIARDPVLYRRLDLSDPWDRFNECDFEPVVELVLQAIDRSCGQLEDFSIRYFGTDEMLQRIVDTSCRLKKLTLAICDEVSDDALLEVVANMPCWEEVEICQCSFSLMAIEAVGRACKSTLPSTDCRQSRISIFNSVLTSPNDSRVMSLMPFEDDYNKDYESVFRMWLSYKFDATSCF